MVAPRPVKKSVSDLKSSLLRPALTSHFFCWFEPPQLVQAFINSRAGAGIGNGSNRDAYELVSLSCSEASLPGSSLATHEANNDFTGVTERHVYRRQYDDRADFTFYVDHDYNVLQFFENWMSYIVNEQASGGIENENFSYRVNFPDNYKTTIYIKKFEKDYLGKILQYRFINAYPISIASIPVSYESSQLLKCTVSFNYSRYVIGGGDNLTLQEALDTTEVFADPGIPGTTIFPAGVPVPPILRPAPTGPGDPFRSPNGGEFA
jgi:hypothetical protein